MKVLWSPIYYKVEGDYFKGKIWVLYKLTVTKYPNVRRFYPHNRKCQFDVNRGGFPYDLANIFQ